MYKDNYTLEDYDKATDECCERIKKLLLTRFDELEELREAINDRYPFNDLFLKWVEVSDEEYLIQYLLNQLEPGIAEVKEKRKEEYEEAKRVLTQQ